MAKEKEAPKKPDGPMRSHKAMAMGEDAVRSQEKVAGTIKK